MAKIICDMVRCKHRSKRPMRSYIKKSGEKCYGCMLDVTDIVRISDPDDYVVDTIGEENMASCIHYEPIEEEEEWDDI